MSDAKLDKLEELIRACFKDCRAERDLDTLILWVEAKDVVSTLKSLRDDDDLDFRLMVDLTAVHYPKREKPLEVVYQLLSVYKNHRIRVKVDLAEGETLPTITGLWFCADWYERELYDMFGVLVTGHPDLRRILNQYDFEGHPLRKDFPLNGYTEVRYDESLGRVVTEPTKLDQEDREYYGR